MTIWPIVFAIGGWCWFWFAIYHFNKRTDKKRKCNLKDFLIEIPMIWIAIIARRSVNVF